MEFKSHRIGGAMRQPVNTSAPHISRVFIFESFVIVSRLHLFEYYGINHITINRRLLVIIVESGINHGRNEIRETKISIKDENKYRIKFSSKSSLKNFQVQMKLEADSLANLIEHDYFIFTNKQKV